MTGDPLADREARDDAWRAQHGREVAEVLGRGDPAEIKRLYVSMGDLLEQGFADDVEGVPLLSLPETTPVVVDLLGGVGPVVLDAGCGPGAVASLALLDDDAERRVVALDIGPGTVGLARQRALARGVDLDVVVGDLEDLPFRDGAFDGLVSDDTIEHVPDDRRAVRELARVIGPSGVAVVATPNRHSVAVLAERLGDLARGRRRRRRDYFVAESHLREYTWREFSDLVGGAFTLEAVGAVGWRGRVVSRLVTRIIELPGGRRLDRMIVARLRPRG